MQPQHLAFHAHAVAGSRCVQSAVNTDAPLEAGAAFGNFDGCGAPRAKADSGDVGDVDVGIFQQGVEARLGAAAQELALPLVLAGQSADLVRVFGVSALAVDVGDEGEGALLRQLFGLFLGEQRNAP